MTLRAVQENVEAVRRMWTHKFVPNPEISGHIPGCQ